MTDLLIGLSERVAAAYQMVRADLLAERSPAGHWVGELASSSLSTATAVSALAIVRKHLLAQPGSRTHSSAEGLGELIAGGLRWLVKNQNSDGGFGDTDRSHSNIATSMLVVAAIHLAEATQQYAASLTAANAYIDRQGRIAGLRKRYGKDKTFVVPILTNCALAGLVDWREIPPLPFELACVPQSWYRFVKMPVVSYAIPALVAIGQAHYFHRKPWNPYSRIVRGLAIGRSIRVLQTMQPQSGGYLEATPLTSFVVMSLAATGRELHPVTTAGVQFLLDSVRPDGSWPIDTNLATWVTTLSINSLHAGGEDIAATVGEPALDWLLRCQHRQRHPFTGADPGGWGWTDLSGAVPDADDTPGALLALAAWRDSPSCTPLQRAKILAAVQPGIDWLWGLQNRDGGWPTFCRGWGTLPFDRSGTDLTAHALRALAAWPELAYVKPAQKRAKVRALAYVARHQQADGSWLPLWFGNQDHPEEENPVYGTAKVLRLYLELGLATEPAPLRGVQYLVKSQNPDGSFGSSLEETALAVSSLKAFGSLDESAKVSASKGLAWICQQVEAGGYQRAAPIGFYFAKLWYYERLYPVIFALEALAPQLKK